MERLSHIGADGSAQMVDVSGKPVSLREATAAGRISVRPETLELIEENRIAKGNVFATARLAGIQAAKQTSSLIPLCHNLNLTHVELEITAVEGAVEVTCTARTSGQTGVEMETLIGVSVALLTIYDMCKAVDKQMKICEVHLVKKTKTPIDS
jgi:cyclic pyranopterin monophosphate synthase